MTVIDSPRSKILTVFSAESLIHSGNSEIQNCKLEKQLDLIGNATMKAVITSPDAVNLTKKKNEEKRRDPPPKDFC